MCGIVGLWNTSTERPLAHVGAMLDAVKHRGPDGRGTLEYAGGAAGMVRLALVDLSVRGQQPIWSEDRRVAILRRGRPSRGSLVARWTPAEPPAKPGYAPPRPAQRRYSVPSGDLAQLICPSRGMCTGLINLSSCN